MPSQEVPFRAVGVMYCGVVHWSNNQGAGKSRPATNGRSTITIEKYVAPVALLVPQATGTALESLPPTPAAAVNPFSGELVVPCSDSKIVRDARAQRVNRVLARPPPRQALSSAHPVGQVTIRVHVGETDRMCFACKLVKHWG